MPVLAHPGHAGTTGFMHPLSGLDHVLAMISVGLWAARSGGRAVWLVPTAFLVSMVVHLTGVGLAQFLRAPRRAMLVRGLGGAVAACGLLLLGAFT